MVRSKTSSKVVKSMGRDKHMVGNPIFHIIFEVRDTISTPSINDGDMVKFSVGISIVKPVNVGMNFPEISIIFFNMGRFKVLQERTIGISSRTLNTIDTRE